MKKDKYRLMGQFVSVKFYMKAARAFCARSYMKYELKTERVGMVIGYRTVYEGKIQPGNYNPEYFEPNYLTEIKSVKVILVCFWPTYKPVLVLPEDIIMINNQGWGRTVPDYLHPTSRTWSEKDREEERKYAAERKRDSKGRWIK